MALKERWRHCERCFKILQRDEMGKSISSPKFASKGKICYQLLSHISWFEASFLLLICRLLRTKQSTYLSTSGTSSLRRPTHRNREMQSGERPSSLEPATTKRSRMQDWNSFKFMSFMHFFDSEIKFYFRLRLCYRISILRFFIFVYVYAIVLVYYVYIYVNVFVLTFNS